MKKLLLVFVSFTFCATLLAQNVTIRYDATKGTTGLVGAASVYMHSGGSDEGVPNDCWECVIGNWGQDDAIGKLTSVGTDLWEITLADAFAYYGAATGCTFDVTGVNVVTCMGMVFRNADGTLTGKDYNDADIFVNLTGLTPVVTQSDGTPFDGVTVVLNTGVNDVLNSNFLVTAYPNPVSEHGLIAYTLNNPAQEISIRMFDLTGRQLDEYKVQNQGNGTYLYNFDARSLSTGLYNFVITVDGASKAGKLAVIN